MNAEPNPQPGVPGQPGAGQPGQTPAGQSPMSDKDERNWAMLTHFAGLAGYVVPLGNVIGPLILWLVRKDQSAFVDNQGKEAVNFQLSILLYLVISVVSIIVLIGFVLLFAVLVFQIVTTLVAGVKASEGVWFRYPLSIRFIQ